jgi:PAS domain S-box-containing protein
MDADPALADLPLLDFAQHVRGYAILSLDAEGRIRTWNEGARLVKGYEPEEIIGQPYARFFCPEDVADGLPGRILDTTRETGLYEGEGWRMRKDGSRFWAHVHVTAIRDAEGAVIGFGKITQDLTEQRAAAQALAERAKELERSNAELERFAYVTSHDLSEPLRSIAGYGELLARRLGEDLDPESRRYLERIGAATTRMQALIDDLLAYSRSGRRELVREPVELGQVAADALEALTATISARDAVVRVHKLPRVSGDPLMLGQLLQNLISNAVKFSEDVPEVEIGSEPTADGYTVWVADRGIGVEPEHAERVLTLFQRLHPRSRFEGTGVGLAICERVVDRHGGRLWLEPRAGGGTIVRFTLPDVA